MNLLGELPIDTAGPCFLAAGGLDNWAAGFLHVCRAGGLSLCFEPRSCAIRARFCSDADGEHEEELDEDDDVEEEDVVDMDALRSCTFSFFPCWSLPKSHFPVS